MKGFFSFLNTSYFLLSNAAWPHPMPQCNKKAPALFGQKLLYKLF